ncbi:Ribosome-releasing factor 2, mitochondrial, partial [Coemansia erecta]
DERPLAEALASLTLEDPSLHVSADAETGQTLVSGMGELHLDVVRDRLLNDMRVNASFGAMRVAYRETPGQVARAAFEYVRETAGRMAHAEVELEVAPLDPEDEEGCDVKGERDAADGNVVEVADAVVDSAAANGGTLQGEVLREVRAAAAGGVHGALARGVLLGFPVAHARVRILRLGHISDELSSPAAFRACAAQALQQALRASSPQLLEPLARAAVRCPAGALGAVLADLNGARRGRVLALDEDAADAEVKVVLAEVPLSAMVGYASVLRSLSAGQASFAMQVVGFGAMAQHEQQKVLSRAHVV